ncbi:MAG: hypothetical protein JWP68_2720 [Modestobacter sp.]|nr:hypothetical protein [Modestobacter sp.]
MAGVGDSDHPCSAALPHPVCTGVSADRLGALIAEPAEPWQDGAIRRCASAAVAGSAARSRRPPRPGAAVRRTGDRHPGCAAMSAAARRAHGVPPGDRSTITRAVHEIRPLLAQRGSPSPATRPADARAGRRVRLRRRRSAPALDGTETAWPSPGCSATAVPLAHDHPAQTAGQHAHPRSRANSRRYRCRSGWSCQRTSKPPEDPPEQLRPPVSAAGRGGRWRSIAGGRLPWCRHRSHDGPARGKIQETEHIATTAVALVVPSRQVVYPRGADCGRGHPTSHTRATQSARLLQCIPDHVDHWANTVDLSPRITGVTLPYGVHDRSHQARPHEVVAVEVGEGGRGPGCSGCSDGLRPRSHRKPCVPHPAALDDAPGGGEHLEHLIELSKAEGHGVVRLGLAPHPAGDPLPRRAAGHPSPLHPRTVVPEWGVIEEAVMRRSACRGLGSRRDRSPQWRLVGHGRLPFTSPV